MIIIDIRSYIDLIILSGFTIIGNIFFLKESKDKADVISGVKKLRWIGVINIIFLGLNFFFPPIIGIDTPTTMYQFLVPLCLIDIPFLVTYGILMYLFGKSVIQEWGNYLKIAGLIGIVGNSLLIPFPVIILISTQTELDITMYSTGINMIMMPLSAVGGFSWLAEYLLIYVNGRKNKIRNLTISGFILSMGFILYIVLEVILLIAFPNYWQDILT
jgi:hypothetical protein